VHLEKDDPSLQAQLEEKDHGTVDIIWAEGVNCVFLEGWINRINWN